MSKLKKIKESYDNKRVISEKIDLTSEIESVGLDIKDPANMLPDLLGLCSDIPTEEEITEIEFELSNSSDLESDLRFILEKYEIKNDRFRKVILKYKDSLKSLKGCI